jgi:hypothetical protein
MPGASSIVQPHELMTDAEQAELRGWLSHGLETFSKAKGKSGPAVLGFLLAFVWGWARRCGYSTQELVNRADQQWNACERVDGIRRAGNLGPNGKH